MNNFIVAVVLIAIYLLWGFYCIRQTFNFFVSAAVLYEVYKPQGECSAFCFALKLVLGKHLGSIFATSFLNAFFFIPSALMDNIRSCAGGKFYNTGCLGGICDLVRPDGIAYLILTGNSYCNSAKYCEYLWFESMTTENIKSSMRMYKMSAQMLVTSSAAIISLFVLGVIEAPFLYLALVMGIVVAAFFIGLNTDVCEAIRLIYLIEQESDKRREEFLKYTNNCLNRADQIKFLKQIPHIYSNKQVGRQIGAIQRDYWKIEQQPPEKAQKSSKMAKKPKENQSLVISSVKQS